MDAQSGDAAFEARISHAGHGEQQLSCKKGRIGHKFTMPLQAPRTSLVGVTNGG
jgi:hypothetical protein